MLKKIAPIIIEQKIVFDSLFEDAARLFVLHQQGSTSLLQRKLKLGYNRAGRIIDQLEQAGIIGEFNGAAARQVHIPDEFALDKKLKDIGAGLFTANIDDAIAPYELLNHDRALNHWHLVTDEALVAELSTAGTANLVHSLQATTPQIVNELKGIGNRVVLLSREPAEWLDMCDSLIAARFVLSVNTIANDYTAYHNWLIDHYTEHKTKEEITANLLTLCEHISWYQNAIEREEIAKQMGRKFGIAKATITREINEFITRREKENVQHVREDENALPAWVDADFYYRYGFVSRQDNEENTGIYFATGSGPKRLTNFVLSPLIHIYTKDEMGNRRLTELNNGFFKTVLELPGKAFTSMETFDNILSNEGAFFTMDGFTKSHLNRLKSYFLLEYPKCFELNTLGWQPEGFFSFSNMIYNKELIQYNPYGYAQIGDQNFLSMSASNVLEGVRQEDDIYKNDKFLSYNESGISLEQWCRLMMKVYPDHGMMAIVFVMMTVFRDILFKRNSNFPLLYFYGPVGSGKSKIAESVANVFTHNMPMFNLSNGTDFAFFSLLSRFTNVAVGLNEFDENTINENWFTAIKGAYDGEGRPKGIGKRNKTTTQAINVAIVLIGQFLSTKDDNSVLSRTLPRKITENSNRSTEQLAAYDELKNHEKKGISSIICELLQHREYITEHFMLRYTAVSATLKEALTRDGIAAKNRIIENFSVALTMAQLMGEKFSLGFTYDAFFNDSKAEITKLSGIMSESNSLSQFWKTVEFLLDQHIIEAGSHFRVETKNEVRISIDRKQTQLKKFEEPKKLLFLRLSTIHMLYMKEVRTQTGKAGQNEQTIITYMKDQESYIGSNPGSHFSDGMNTSSYVFDYDMLGANLERIKNDGILSVVLQGKVMRDAEVVDVIGEAMLSFTLVQDEGYEHDGIKVKKELLTYCLSRDLSMHLFLKRNRDIKVSGSLNEQKAGDRVLRRMQVDKIEVVEAELPLSRSDAEIDAVFGKEAGV